MNDQDQVEGIVPLLVDFHVCPLHLHVITGVDVKLPDNPLLAILGLTSPEEGVVMEVSDVAFSLS